MRWSLTILYTICIYSTLGIVRSISELIRATGNLTVLASLLVGLFLFFLLLLGNWKFSKQQLILRLILALCVISLALFVTKLPEENIHIVEYGLLGWLIGWSLVENPITWYRLGLGVLIGWVIGFGDEIIQYFLPNRVYDIRDVILNGVSATLGLYSVALTKFEQSYLLKNKCCKKNEQDN